uniref:Uncharacterized protein n=1 Tax=Anguilla anguilla TaxID=7936 RepID=A0A0E9RBL4_ANGAN
MSFKITRIGKPLPTQNATVWFLPCVSSLVSFKITQLVESFFTVCTTVRSLPCVNSQVCFKSLCTAQQLPT